MGRSLQQSLCAAPTPTLSTSFQNTLCRAKQGRGTPRYYPNPVRSLLPSGLEEPETSPQRATGFAARKNSLRPAIRLPFAVKFLEFLEPSPKEGSKRGLGQSPKVFFPLSTLSLRGKRGNGECRRFRNASRNCRRGYREARSPLRRESKAAQRQRNAQSRIADTPADANRSP